MQARPFHVSVPLLLLPILLRAQQPVAQQPVATPSDLIAPAMVTAIENEGLQHSHAEAILKDLTSRGHRLTGSDNFTRACAWGVEQFAAMGLHAVHLEKWGTWNLVWNRGKWSGRIVEPIQLDMYVATDAWTAGTGGPRRARIVRAPKTVADAEAMAAAMRGVFLFTGGKRARPDVRQYCEQQGIAGWVYDAYGDARHPDRVRVFGSYQTALGKLEAVPTIPDIAVQHDHAKQLASLLDDGKDVTVEFDLDNRFTEGPIDLHNVVAEIPGSERPDEVVIVCGHLDSWHQAEGCTDNGTGTASTLEAARILMATGAKPKRTIRFILWGGEEQGLLGSVAYVRQHRAEMDKVACVFNHDTGTNWAHSLTVSDSMYEPMQRVCAPLMQLQPPDADFAGPVFVLNHRATIDAGMGGSDHASFFAARVPGLDWGLTGRSDYFGVTWHSQWDKFDVAIPEYQRHTSTVIALCALGVANLPELLDHSGVKNRAGAGQSTSIAQAIFAAEMEGMTFTKVEAGGRAARIGIEVGDTIVAINVKPVQQIFEMFPILRDDDPDELVFTLRRRAAPGETGATRQVRLAASEISNLGNPFDATMDGMTFKTVEPGGRGARLGIEAGDVLLRANGSEVTQLREVRALLRDDGVEQLVFTLRRGDAVIELRATKAQLRAPK